MAQKLLVNKNGRLLIVIREDANYLVNFANCLDVDIYVWPRLSTNYIFENYAKNVQSINEKLFVEFKARKMFAMTSAEKKRLRNKSSASLKTNLTLLDNYYERSLCYMHYVPAKCCLKFNYDFIGTNQYPIENLKEQIFFMFALANTGPSKRINFDFGGKPYELSPNLCRLYDTNFEVGFEQNAAIKFFYLGNTLDNLNQINVNRYLTVDRAEDFFGPSPKEGVSFFSEFSLNLSVERLTLALNDDYMSQVYQTEIIRLTSDCLNLSVTQLRPSHAASLQLDKQIQVTFNCMHFQLDNQMFDLELDEQLSSLKYDFPVVVLPRDVRTSQREHQNTLKSMSYFKSLDSCHYFEHRQCNFHVCPLFFDANAENPVY